MSRNPEYLMDLIDSRQLLAFQLLARTGSFTAAAKKMFVTQSAVSHSIKTLELSLDVTLFDRAGKSIALTAEGEVLLQYADRILESMRQAGDELKAIRLWGYGRLRIGATDTICQHLLPRVIKTFREGFPNCEIAIKSSDTLDLLTKLSGGDIDIAIGIQSQNEEVGFGFLPLFEDHLGYVVPPDHPLSGKKEITDQDLSKERFIVYAKKSPTSLLVERHFKSLGIHNPSLLELGNMEAIKELAKIGMGVGIVSPWVIKEELEQGHLSLVTPPKSEGLIRKWGVYYRGAKDNLPHPTEFFCKTLKAVASSTTRPAAS